MLGEGADLSDLFPDLVGLAFPNEEALQALGGDLLGNPLRVATESSCRQEVAVDVGGEDLNRASGCGCGLREVLAHENGEGVSLLSRSASWHPEAYWRARSSLDDCGDHNSCDEREDFGVAKEMRHPDEQVSMEVLGLGRLMLQIGDIVGDRPGLNELDAAPNTPKQRALFVMAEVVPGLALENLADGGELLSHLIVEIIRRLALKLGDAAGVGQYPSGHLIDRQGEVDQPGRDRALRHAVILRRLRRLRDRQAPVLLDGPQSRRAVAAGAREDDADRALTSIAGQ